MENPFRSGTGGACDFSQPQVRIEKRQWDASGDRDRNVQRISQVKTDYAGDASNVAPTTPTTRRMMMNSGGLIR